MFWALNGQDPRAAANSDRTEPEELVTVAHAVVALGIHGALVTVDESAMPRARPQWLEVAGRVIDVQSRPWQPQGTTIACVRLRVRASASRGAAHPSDLGRRRKPVLRYLQQLASTPDS